MDQTIRSAAYTDLCDKVGNVLLFTRKLISKPFGNFAAIINSRRTISTEYTNHFPSIHYDAMTQDEMITLSFFIHDRNILKKCRGIKSYGYYKKIKS